MLKNDWGGGAGWYLDQYWALHLFAALFYFMSYFTIELT